jgi:dihydroorotase/N-acyl-D-amino-acid deacylase
MYSLLIRGGQIVDGSGLPAYAADLAVSGDRIVTIASPGSIDPSMASEVVDATGMVVCPGFIDIQSHAILPLMVDGRCLSKITQGVTTEIMGEAWTPAPFGGKIESPVSHALFTERLPEWAERMRSWARFGDWLETVEQYGVSPNIGSFLGGGTLRQYACGMRMGPATAEELAVMRRVMAEAMEDGAFGVSYALIYPPDAFVETPELIEVCKVVAQYQGVYITHVRSEAAQLIEGIEEAITIGQQAGLPVEIYHLKAAGRSNWHKMPEVIRIVEAAQAAGLDVTADMYPYTAAGTGLTSVLPPWADADGKLYENLADPEMRAKIRAEALNPAGGWEAMVAEMGAEAVMPIGFHKPENLQYIGKRLSEIAAMRGQAWVDAAIDLLVSEGQRIGTIYFLMDEANVKLQLALPWIKISTDAGGYDPEWAKAFGPVHPRSYGTYTRVLGKYVREEAVISLEDAIWKMSGAVADRLGIADRGRLGAGKLADIVIFDPTTVGDRATFEEPHQLSVGIRDVWVNGVRVLADGAHTGAKPGRFLRGRGATKV